MKQIIIDCLPGGKSTIDVKGFKDGGCLKETADIEAALGKVEEREKKPEAYIAPAAQKLTVGG